MSARLISVADRFERFRGGSRSPRELTDHPYTDVKCPLESPIRSNDGISLWCRCDLLEMQQNMVVKAARRGLKQMKLEATASVVNRLRNVTLF